MNYNLKYLFKNHNIENLNIEKYYDDNLIFNILLYFYKHIYIHNHYFSSAKFKKFILLTFLEENNYDPNILNISKIEKDLEQYFVFNKNPTIFLLKPEINCILRTIYSLILKINLINKQEIEFNFDLFLKEQNLELIDFSNSVILYWLFLKENYQNEKINFANLFFMLQNIDAFKSEIKSFKEKNDLFKREFKFEDNKLNFFLRKININSWALLSMCSVDFLIFLFFNRMNWLSLETYNKTKLLEKEFLKKIKDLNIGLELFIRDNEYRDEHYKIFKKLKKENWDVKILDEVFKLINTKYYFFVEDIENDILEQNTLELLKIWLNYWRNDKYKVNKKYNFFFLREFIDLNEIKNNLPVFLHLNELNNFDSLARKIIENEYKKHGNIYFKVGTSYIFLLIKEIKENFKEGFKIDQSNPNDDYFKILNVMKQKYGIDDFNFRPIDSILVRNDFISINRGVYLHKDDFKYEWINFINMHSNEIREYIDNEILQKKFVLYNDIFKKYYIILKNNNIDNWNLLKGLIDYYIIRQDNKYITDRDSIKFKIQNSININTEILDYIKKISGVYKIQYLLEKFPGKEEYFFDQIFDKNKNSILKLKSKKYINAKDVNIDELLKEKIIENAENTLLKSGYYVSTAKVLFDNFKNEYQNDFKNIPDYFKNEFSFFSLVNYLWLKYNDVNINISFKRPFFWDSLQYDKMTTTKLVKTYICKNNKKCISRKELNNFLSLFKFGSNIDLNSLIENCDFVRIDMDNYLDKNLFKFNDNQIFNIKNILEDYFLSEDSNKISLSSIDYTLFYSYNNFNWNKFSLISFIKEYLSMDFKIEDNLILEKLLK